jgi:hypothetical protein
MPCLVIVVGSRRPPNTWYSSRPGLGDPSFKPAPMPTARYALAAAPLGSGLVGVFGGNDSGGSILSANEVYNHNTNTWASRAPMPTGRYYLAAAPLEPGLAGVFGGFNGTSHLGVNELYAY